MEYADEIPRDHAKACLWYRKAAELGHEQAQKRLGELDTLSNCKAPPRRVTPKHSINWAGTITDLPVTRSLPYDREKALEHYLCAVQQNHALAAQSAAHLYLQKDDYAQSLA